MTQPIVGYRNLLAAEVELINELKAQGNNLGELIEALGKIDSVDQRWFNIGRTHMQQGLMALTRAIARPTTF